MTDLHEKLARLKELAAKAKAVVPGKVFWYCVADFADEGYNPDDAAFFAACDPDTILALVQAAERGMEYEKALREIVAVEPREGGWDGLTLKSVIAGTESAKRIAREALASDPPQGKEEESDDGR